MAKGSALSRSVRFFREADIDEARVAFSLVKEVMDGRLNPTGQTISRKLRKRRRTKAEIAAQNLMEKEAPGLAASA